VTEFAQQLLNAVSLGGIYALLALGLAIVFSILHLINFAHGELITLPGYAMYGMYLLGMPWTAFAALSILVGVLAALAMERVAFRPVRNASPATMLLTSLGLSIIIQGLLQMLISPREKAVPQPDWLLASHEVGSLRIQTQQIAAVVVTLAALAALTLLLRRTRTGIAMRAAAEDIDATRLMGIRANRVIATAFAISGALAALAGLLILARRGTVHPSMGLLPVLKAFVATVLGGFGSLGGAVVGGFVLGFLEVALRAWLPDDVTGFTDGLLFAIVGLILFFRPNGLFGKVEVVRA
jgi:branched-chain amino acid transport system permease protein